jgi:hypothetical protein
MSEAKKIAIGVLGGISGIAALFALVLMLAGKGDEPAARPVPLPAQAQAKPPVSAPAPPLPAEATEQPQPLLAEQSPSPAPGAQPEAAPAAQARAVEESSAGRQQATPPQLLARTEPKINPAIDSPVADTSTRTESKAASAPAITIQNKLLPQYEEVLLAHTNKAGQHPSTIHPILLCTSPRDKRTETGQPHHAQTRHLQHLTAKGT